jgi:hypothetical protein
VLTILLLALALYKLVHLLMLLLIELRLGGPTKAVKVFFVTGLGIAAAYVFDVDLVHPIISGLVIATLASCVYTVMRMVHEIGTAARVSAAVPRRNRRF